MFPDNCSDLTVSWMFFYFHTSLFIKVQTPVSTSGGNTSPHCGVILLRLQADITTHLILVFLGASFWAFPLWVFCYFAHIEKIWVETRRLICTTCLCPSVKVWMIMTQTNHTDVVSFWITRESSLAVKKTTSELNRKHVTASGNVPCVINNEHISTQTL